MTFTQWINKEKQLNPHMLRHSMLFLTFFLLLFTWTTKETNTVVTIAYIRYGWHPFEFDNSLILESSRIVTGVLFFIFFSAVFLKSVSLQFQYFPKSVVYWFSVGFTYCFSIIRGIQNIPSPFVFFVWVIVCAIFVIIFIFFVKAIIKYIVSLKRAKRPTHWIKKLLFPPR